MLSKKRKVAIQAKGRKKPVSSIPPKDAPARFWLGVNICAARRRAKLTQEQLAQRIGITAKTLSNIENVAPRSSFRFDTFEAIATALKTTPLALITPSLDSIPRV
jgi:DNA-binding XRE family transcriptional regulator